MAGKGSKVYKDRLLDRLDHITSEEHKLRYKIQAGQDSRAARVDQLKNCAILTKSIKDQLQAVESDRGRTEAWLDMLGFDVYRDEAESMSLCRIHTEALDNREFQLNKDLRQQLKVQATMKVAHSQSNAIETRYIVRLRKVMALKGRMLNELQEIQQSGKKAGSSKHHAVKKEEKTPTRGRAPIPVHRTVHQRRGDIDHVRYEPVQYPYGGRYTAERAARRDSEKASEQRAKKDGLLPIIPNGNAAVEKTRFTPHQQKIRQDSLGPAVARLLARRPQQAPLKIPAVIITEPTPTFGTPKSSESLIITKTNIVMPPINSNKRDRRP